MQGDLDRGVIEDDQHSQNPQEDGGLERMIGEQHLLRPLIAAYGSYRDILR